jgi:hypothetical protein
LKIKFEHGAFPEVIDAWIKFACLFQQMGLQRLYHMLKGNMYPDEEMTFYFYGNGDLNKVMKGLQKHFKEGLIHLHVSEGYPCDGCGDVKSAATVNTKKMNRWFFCESCAVKYFPGFFSEKELLKEIQLCDKEENLWKRANLPYWYYYIHKIKRSCRFHQMEYPDWIELGYDR